MQLAFPFVNTGWERKPIRRRVFRVRLEPLEDGTYIFKAKSFTRQWGHSYRCRVNPRTGYVWCSCRDYKYRKGRLQPTFEHGPYCKHLDRAVRTVRKIVRSQEPAAPSIAA